MGKNLSESENAELNAIYVALLRQMLDALHATVELGDRLGKTPDSAVLPWSCCLGTNIGQILATLKLSPRAARIAIADVAELAMSGFIRRRNENKKTKPVRKPKAKADAPDLGSTPSDPSQN